MHMVEIPKAKSVTFWDFFLIYINMLQLSQVQLTLKKINMAIFKKNVVIIREQKNAIQNFFHPLLTSFIHSMFKI